VGSSSISFISTVPYGQINVSIGGDEDDRNNGSNVKCGPLGKDLVVHGMGSKGRITHLVKMFLNGVSTLIINWFFLIMIVVSLDDIPILIGEVNDFISSIDLFLNDGTFVGLNS